MTPLELAVRRNKGKQLLPVFLDSISRFERFREEKPKISFASLEKTDADTDFIRRALGSTAECPVFLRRWVDPHRAEEFFRTWASIHLPSACRILVQDSMYFGSMFIDGNAGIYHAMDFARLDGDTASFILGDRKSCFYVDIVDDFDFVGIEAKFCGNIIMDMKELPVDFPEVR